MRESASSASCLTRPTTPTTVIHGACRDVEPPVRMRLPSALLVRPELLRHVLVDDGDARRCPACPAR